MRVLQRGQSRQLRGDSRTPHSPPEVAVRGGGEIPRALLLRRERCAGLRATLKDPPAKGGYLWAGVTRLGPSSPLSRNAGFPSSHWKMLPMRPEERTCRPEPEKQQLPPLDRESNYPQWAPASRKLRRGAEGPEGSRLGTSSPSLISFHSWFSCSKEPRRPGHSLKKNIPVPRGGMERGLAAPALKA